MCFFALPWRVMKLTPWKCRPSTFALCLIYIHSTSILRSLRVETVPGKQIDSVGLLAFNVCVFLFAPFETIPK